MLVRLMKVRASGLEGGTSFMEDYTYHLTPNGPKVLGAHKLEVCPSIASEQPSCEIPARPSAARGPGAASVHSPAWPRRAGRAAGF